MQKYIKIESLLMVECANKQLNHFFRASIDSIANITLLGKSYSCFSTTTQSGNPSIESVIQLKLRNLSNAGNATPSRLEFHTFEPSYEAHCVDVHVLDFSHRVDQENLKE